MLNGLFVPLAGFKEVRHLPARNCAFIEFVDVSTASYALSVLKSHRLNETHAIKIKFCETIITILSNIKINDGNSNIYLLEVPSKNRNAFF